MTKVEATTSDQNSEDKTLEGEQDKNGENRETPAKQPEKPENVVDTKKERKVQKSMKALRKEYYEFALPLWQKTTPFPDIPPQNDHRLRDPNIWRFNNNNVFESKANQAKYLCCQCPPVNYMYRLYENFQVKKINKKICDFDIT